MSMDGPRCARACMVGGTEIPGLAPWAPDGRPLAGRGAWGRIRDGIRDRVRDRDRVRVRIRVRICTDSCGL